MNNIKPFNPFDETFVSTFVFDQFSFFESFDNLIIYSAEFIIGKAHKQNHHPSKSIS